MTLAATERSVWLATFMLPHEPQLRRWLERKHVRGIEIDDVVQETYAMLMRLESVAEIRNAKAYIYQTAYSVLLVHLRRARVVSIRAVATIEQFAGADPGPSPEQVVADREELHKMAEALARLPGRCREVFVLRKVHGLSQRDVGAALGISEGTVEKHVHKGLRMLMDVLGRGGKHMPGASTVDGLADAAESGAYSDAGDKRRN